MKRYVLLRTTYAGHTTYGIGWMETDGHTAVLTDCYANLSPKSAPVRRLVNRCNLMRLDPAHLRDAVEDFLADL